MAKIGSIKNVVGEKIVGYRYTHSDQNSNTNGNLVLCFESGKELFISSVVDKISFNAELFLSPEDENAHQKP